jgi:iron-sulfur cluster assembly protein
MCRHDGDTRPAHSRHTEPDRSAMLTITEDAAQLVRTLTADADNPDNPHHPGLRIVVDDVNHSLSMGLADTPEAADTIVDLDGARVFLSPDAVTRLGTKRLQAEITDDRSRFYLDR